MNLNEIVGEVIKGNSGGMIFQLARKPVAQARISAQRGAYRPILPFNERRGNMLRVRVSNHCFHLTPDTTSRRIFPRLFFSRTAVNFLKLGEIHIPAKFVFDGLQIRTVGISGYLNAMREPASDVAYEILRRRQIALAKPPRWNELAIGINAHPKPHVASIGILTRNRLSAILFLAINPTPHLIELQPLAAQLAKCAVLVIGADFAHLN